MRYVADSLLSSLYGVNHVVNPFKLQKHSPPLLSTCYILSLTASLYSFLPQTRPNAQYTKFNYRSIMT